MTDREKADTWKAKYEEEHRRRCSLEHRFDHRIQGNAVVDTVRSFLLKGGIHPPIIALILWAQALEAQVLYLQPLESLAVKLSDAYDLAACTDELVTFAKTWKSKA